MDAPDPQEAESGRERQRLVQFSIFWSQMVAFGYVPLLDYAGLKNLNVWSLRTPLLSSPKALSQLLEVSTDKDCLGMMEVCPPARTLQPGHVLTLE